MQQNVLLLLCWTMKVNGDQNYRGRFSEQDIKWILYILADPSYKAFVRIQNTKSTQISLMSLFDWPLLVPIHFHCIEQTT